MRSELTIGDCRPEVQAFAALMEETLRRHDRKGGWRHLCRSALYTRLQGEVGELQTELIDGRSEDQICRETIDIANYALMLCDIVGGLEVETVEQQEARHERELREMREAALEADHE